MKKVYFLAALLFAGLSATAQQVTNGGLNSWSTKTAGMGTYVQPDGPWLNLFDSLFVSLGLPGASSTVTEGTSGSSEGTSHAVLNVVDFSGNTFGGGLIYGKFDVANDMVIGLPIAPRPTSVMLDYQYTTTNGDTAIIEIHANNDPTSPQVIFNTSATSWTPFEYVFQWTQSGQDSIALAFGLANPNDTALDPGSQFRIDNVRYNFPLGFTEMLDKKKMIEVYPNPATETIRFSLEAADNLTLEVYDMHGNLVRSFNQLSTENALYVGDLGKGTYIYTLSNQQSKMIVDRGQFVKN